MTILTREEAKFVADSTKRIIITSFDKDGKTYYFHNDKHTDQGLGDKAVPITFYIPQTVTPREGLEDGIVYNIETWEFVYGKNDILLETWEEVQRIFYNIPDDYMIENPPTDHMSLESNDDLYGFM